MKDVVMNYNNMYETAYGCNYDNIYGEDYGDLETSMEDSNTKIKNSEEYKNKHNLMKTCRKILDNGLDSYVEEIKNKINSLNINYSILINKYNYKSLISQIINQAEIKELEFVMDLVRINDNNQIDIEVSYQNSTTYIRNTSNDLKRMAIKVIDFLFFKMNNSDLMDLISKITATELEQPTLIIDNLDYNQKDLRKAITYCTAVNTSEFKRVEELGIGDIAEGKDILTEEFLSDMTKLMKDGLVISILTKQNTRMLNRLGLTKEDKKLIVEKFLNEVDYEKVYVDKPKTKGGINLQAFNDKEIKSENKPFSIREYIGVSQSKEHFYVDFNGIKLSFDDDNNFIS